MSKWRIDSRENALTNDWRKSSQQWEAKAKALEKEVVALRAQLGIKNNEEEKDQ